MIQQIYGEVVDLWHWEDLSLLGMQITPKQKTLQALCSFERLKCDLKIISFGKCKDQVCAMVPTKWSIVAQLFGQNGRHAW